MIEDCRALSAISCLGLGLRLFFEHLFPSAG